MTDAEIAELVAATLAPPTCRCGGEPEIADSPGWFWYACTRFCGNAGYGGRTPLAVIRRYREECEQLDGIRNHSA